MSEKLINLLMRRDGITRQEAKNLINECADALIDGQETAIMDILGLEDDYIFDVLEGVY